MNRGFAFYFAKGMRTAAKSILKGGKLLQYYIYFFAGLIGRLLPFVGMIFFVSDVRRAKIAKDEGDLTILRPFGGVEKGASFGAAVLSSLLLLLLLLGGLSIAAGIGYGLYIGGYAFGKAVDVNPPAILGVVFAIPAIAAALVYMIALLLLFAPVPYIIDTNEKIGASAALTASVETMRRGGKLTCFLNVVVPLLIKSAYCGLVYGIWWGLMLLVGYKIVVLVSVSIVWAAIALVGYIVFAPVFTLATTVANTCLFEDISLDPAALDNRTKGVFVKRSRIHDRTDPAALENDLLDLFETEPQYQPPPVPPLKAERMPPRETAEPPVVETVETVEAVAMDNTQETDAL